MASTPAVISADDHIDLQYLPAELFTERLPSSLRHRAPAVVEAEDGPVWVVEDRAWGAWAGGGSSSKTRSFRTALERGGVAQPGVLRPTIAELRLTDMDRDGVDATVMYGPVRALDVIDPTLRAAVHTAYNDWLGDLCAAAPERLIGVAVVPAEDPGAAEAEVRRLAAAGGTRQVSLHIARTSEPIWTEPWFGFWDAIAETELIASFHLVLDPGLLADFDRRPAAVFDTTKAFIGQFLDPVVGLLGHGILERRPEARLVLAESGLGWLPWVVQELDFRYERLVGNRAYWDERGGIGIDERPSDVFRRQVWVTFQDDRVGLDLLRWFGDDKVMWASDYPHPDSTWPDSLAAIDRQTGTLPDAVRRALVHDNAAALYQL